MKKINWVPSKFQILSISLAAFLLPICMVEYRVLQFTGGTFAYPIDDVFIHLTIARNLAYHGVWGVSGHEFASAASSLLYPLILAIAIKIAGAHIILPFIANVLAGIIFLFVLQSCLDKQGVTGMAQLWVILAVIFFVPLPILAIGGMEHIFQLLFTFLFITSFSEALSNLIQSGKKEWNFPWTVYLYGALMTATRYEGLLLLGIACLIVMIHRQIFPALQLALLCALPVLLFGIYSLSQGSYFFPNSVLLKSGAPPVTVTGLEEFIKVDFPLKLFYNTNYKLVADQRLLFLLPLTYLVFNKQIRDNSPYKYMLVVLMAGTFIHIFTTGYSHFPRYEAYLIGCSVAIMGAVTAKYRKEVFSQQPLLTRWIAGLSILLLFCPLILRTTTISGEIRQACINVYEQQFQMGQFLHNYYFHDPVAIGDIGAVSYYTDGTNLDMAGLANLDVAASRRRHYNTPDFMDWLSKKDSVKIAIVYDFLNDPRLLSRWVKVANWQIPNNVACGDDNVTFYAVEKDAAPALKENLLAFQKSLPGDVIVKYY